MVEVKHKFLSSKGDGPDSTRVRPTNWNDDHDVTTTADGVVLGRPAGAGPGPVQEVAMASLFFPGMLLPYAGAVAPAGWLLCEGQSLLRVDYPNLFLAIGTAYGQGDLAGSTFAAPDCRGRTIVGSDAGTGRLPGWVLGTAGGEYAHTLTIAELAAHSHAVSDPGHTHSIPGLYLNFGGIGGNIGAVASGPQPIWQSEYPATVGTGIGVANNGSGAAHNNVQPSIAMNIIIKT